MTAGGPLVQGSLDALKTRPFEKVPQRIGQPFPHGEALRRADMLQEMNFKHSGSHRTLRGHSRSAARKFPLKMIPDTTDNLGSCGAKATETFKTEKMRLGGVEKV